MPCYSPIAAYRPHGDSAVSFKHTEDSDSVFLPCGQCIGCRLERSRQWAVRMVHESQMHESNSFITLTYSPAELPTDGSVNICHFQDFMKRLRSRLAPKRIRFFHCGEYGERLSRPHYHAVIFGYDFPDKVFFKEINGNSTFTSSFLDDTWCRGFCLVGDVSFDSCAYVARYVVKKINGDAAHDHYWKLNELTGELGRVSPEYATMSRRPGIGASWFSEFGDQVERWDSVVMRGFEMKPPRFYESLFDAFELEGVKGVREVEGISRCSEQTPARLRSRRIVKEAQVSLLRRGFENET